MSKKYVASNVAYIFPTKQVQDHKWTESHESTHTQDNVRSFAHSNLLFASIAVRIGTATIYMDVVLE